jgi:hypothetical protein
MKKLLMVAIVLFLGACQKDSSFNPIIEKANISKIKPEIRAILNKMVAKGIMNQEDLQALLSKKSTANARKIGGLGLKINLTAKSKLSKNVDFQFYSRLRQRVIDGDQYECGPTKIGDFFNDFLNSLNDEEFLVFIFSTYVFDISYLYNNTQISKPYFGANGEFTGENNRTIKDLYRFWSSPQLPVFDAIHGATFKNTTLVAKFFDEGYPMLYGDDVFNATEAMELAMFLKDGLNTPKFQFYSHPSITFNAFQASADPSLGIAQKILMGDGVIRYYADQGFKDVSTQVVLAHEFGHYLQELYGYFDGDEYIIPESTRRLELGADAFSAYYSTHSRGAALNKTRVANLQEALFQIGDCAFDSYGHHGTPNQRRRAAALGIKIAEDNQKQGKILTVPEFKAVFDANYASLIAPDAL